MPFQPKVALSQDFLLNLSKLPAAIQGKVLKWALRFQADPTSTGINYENIQGARDSNLKSVRIDQDWRGIVFKPTKGDVYVLLYVGHHDDAYHWAEGRRLTINPVTGAMQVVVVSEVPATPVAAAAEVVAQAQASPLLFADPSDQDLLSLGVPQECLVQVRAIRSEAELDEAQPMLPVEAYEGLFLLAAGETVSQILHARETRVDRVIDTQDFVASLETAESQSRFVVVDTDAELTAIMNAPLAQWRVFLHPTQRKLASGDRSGPVRILGGAGTGKTVLAMHRAKWLAENRTPEGKKVLITTFTRNLAFDIEANLSTFCSPQTMKKMEIKNLDAWVHGFLREHRFEHTIVYNRQKEAVEAWQSALAVKDVSLGLPDSFYEQELEQVVLAQGVTTLDEYRSARRVGRGVLLSRSKRDAVWPVFEEYRHQLTSRKLKEVDDAYRDAADTFEQKHPEGRYSAIVVDETQDFGPQALRLLRALIGPGPNDLFFVGDGHQRIYSRNKAAMSRCGIDIRGRSKKLYLNYRTTEEIRLQAVALLEGCEVDNLDDGHDETKRYKSLSHGAKPIVSNLGSLDVAMQELVSVLGRWRAEEGGASRSLCVITATKILRDNCQSLLRGKGLKTAVIEANDRDAGDAAVIRLATTHRAKGLEFDQVVVLAPASSLGDKVETLGARKLLYVALTRAKQDAALLMY
jgi:superfamily I DNA/RNA helicase